MRAYRLLRVGLSLTLLLLLTAGLGVPDGTSAHSPSTYSNASNYAGLAVGVPWEKIGGEVDVGGVNILFGSADGLSTTGDQWFDQNTSGTTGLAEADDRFGYALAIGDMNGDSYPDLAIGVPFKDIGIESNAGGVMVLYGSPGGLSTTGSQWFEQGLSGIPDWAETTDWFGRALASGDLNCDGFADLVVGAPGENLGVSMGDAGGVTVLYGSSTGLTTTGSQWFEQNNPGIIGTSEAGDRFGSALATGDINGDGCTDLVVGVPEERVGSAAAAGGVNVLYGSSGGLSTTSSQWFDQNTPGTPDSAETGDKYGSALAVGDINGDHYADLVVGAPDEKVESTIAAGGVTILYGSSAGLSTTYSKWFDQNNPGIIGTAETGDHFGSALAVGDLNSDDHADLIVGVPGEQVGSAGSAGGVNVLYGSHDGLTLSGSQWFDQNTPGTPGSAEAGDRFGHALAIGDLNADGYADLAVGAPNEDVGAGIDAGGVNIFYSSPDGLSTAGCLWFDQRTPGITGSAELGDNYGYALAIWSVPMYAIYLPLILR